MNIKDYFTKNQNIIIAFSGGVDSALLLFLAKKYCRNVQAVFVKSEFQPDFELNGAIKTAEEIGVKLNVINISVFDNEKIISNNQDRCYHCKKAIMQSICTFAKKYDGYTVIDGTNASDNADERPGYKALLELSVQSPLRLCGMTKKDIRKTAEKYSIRVFDKPSYSCLATRITPKTKITHELLDITQKAESEMFAIGLSDFRVRFCNSNAVLQMSGKDFTVFNSKREEIYTALKKYYNNVYLDLRERKDG